MKRQFVQFNPSRDQNGFTPPEEQSSEAPAQSREAAPSTKPYRPGNKKTGLLSGHASSSANQWQNPSAAQQEPPAASWAIREDEPPAASWAIKDDKPPAASWAYVDEQETSFTPDLPAERYTDPFMRRDEAEDFLSRRVSPHQSAIVHSPFEPQQHPNGPMQPPQPIQQRPQVRPFTPPPTGYAAQNARPIQQPPFPQPAPFSSVQAPGAPMRPPGNNMAPPQQPVYLRGPAPQSQQAPMSAFNRSGYLNGPPPSMHDMAKHKKARKKKRLPLWAGALIAALVIMIAAGGYVYASPYLSIVSNSTGQTATQFGTGTKKGSATQTSSGPLLSQPTNILLLGSDTDAKFQGQGGSYLAQTDIIVRIDPTTKYVGMLSIPRDLQVTIPEHGADKLDLAFAYGYQSHKTSNAIADGAGLAIATIEQNFGIPIDGYAWVGLDGFIKVINTAGGVDVDVLHPMVDDTYPDDVNASTGQTHTNLNDAYGYKRLYIAPGPQHLTGVQALEYVRTRHSDLVGDFGRSVRQQQVLNQLKAKLQTSDTVAKLPDLAKDLDGYVKTSMSLSDLASLANFARTIDANKIDRLVLSSPYSTSIKNSSNFAPVCDKIIPAIQKMFNLTADQATCIPQTQSGSAGLAAPRIPSTGSTAQHTVAIPTANAAVLLTRAVSSSTQMTMVNANQLYRDPFGVKRLLNLMFMVTFESVGAMTTA